MSREDDLKKLILTYERRLQKLKEKQAVKGINAEAELLIEIEDIEVEIEKLQTELKILESSSIHNVRQKSQKTKITKSTEQPTVLLQKCLQESFDPGELTDFCWHNLPDIRSKLSGQESVEEIVRKAIRYCTMQDELDTLWNYLAEANPKKYKMYYDKYGSSFDYVNRLR